MLKASLSPTSILFTSTNILVEIYGHLVYASLIMSISLASFLDALLDLSTMKKLPRVFLISFVNLSAPIGTKWSSSQYFLSSALVKLSSILLERPMVFLTEYSI